MKKRTEEPIYFTSDSGRNFVLVFESNEYRAYELIHGGKVEMKLGSATPEPLKKYINERW